jgi:hypothetical protein
MTLFLSDQSWFYDDEEGGRISIPWRFATVISFSKSGGCVEKVLLDRLWVPRPQQRTARESLPAR